MRANRFCDRNGNNCTDLTGLGSQWDDVAGGIRYDAGNVGLGMTAGEQRLQVNGNIQIENGNALLLRTEAGNLRGYMAASEGRPWLDIATSGNEGIAFRDGGLGGDINMYIDGRNTRVGVGTVEPTQSLDVNGNTFIRGRVGIGHAGNWHQNLSVKQGMALQGRGNNQGAYLQFYLDGDHHTRFMTYGAQQWRDRIIINKDNGRVGIGTMSPSSALQVAGTIRANQYCDRDGNNCTDLTELGSNWERIQEGLRYNGGNVGIGVNAPSERLHVNGNIRVENGGQIQLLTEVGNLRGMMAASEGRPWLDIATSGNEGIAFRDGGLGGDINMYIDGRNTRVGVGTVEPTQSLDVNGNTFIRGRVGIGHAGNWHQNLSVKQGMALQGRGGNNSAFLQFYLDDNHHTRFMTYGAQGWQDRVMINKDNGNMGIGTMSPGARLHVNGTIRANQICDENGNNCADISDGLSTEASPCAPTMEGLARAGHAYINNGRELSCGLSAVVCAAYWASEGSPHLDIATSGGEDIAFRDGGGQRRQHVHQGHEWARRYRHQQPNSEAACQRQHSRCRRSIGQCEYQ